jgi:hypothetical protein
MLLMVVVAAIVTFVLVMALLAIAVLAESGHLQRIGFDPEAQPFTLSLTEAFDPGHAMLWSTQIPALQVIAAAGTRGLRYHRLLAIYQRTAQKYPELYDGCCFAQWLFFLQSAELIVMGSYRVKITDHGRHFLQCVSELALAA